MKTSNKILIGLLTFVVLVIVSINVALSMKYKRKDFVRLEEFNRSNQTILPLQSFHTVRLEYCNGVNLSVSDTPHLLVNDARRNEDEFTYRVDKGVLVIRPKLVSANDRAWLPLNVNIPQGMPLKIELDQSFISVNKELKLQLLEVKLNEGSELNVDGTIDSLSIMATGGWINLNEPSSIGSLSAELKGEAGLRHGGSKIERLGKLDMSDKSRLETGSGFVQLLRSTNNTNVSK